MVTDPIIPGATHRRTTLSRTLPHGVVPTLLQPPRDPSSEAPLPIPAPQPPMPPILTLAA